MSIMQQFLDEYQNENTKKSYQYHLSNFAHFASTYQTDIIKGNYSEIRNIVKLWLQSSKYQYSSKKTMLTVISAFYEYLIVERHRNDNPCHGIKNIFRSKIIPIYKYPTPELADKLIKTAIATNNTRDILLLLLLRETGMRVSEITKLRVCNINLESNQISVLSSKRGKSRLTTFSDFTKKYLIQHIHDKKLVGDDFLFSYDKIYHTNTQQWKTRSATKMFVWHVISKYAKKANLTQEEYALVKSPHGWRHLWTTEQVKKGTNPIVIQAMGGWSSLTMVEYYIIKNQILANPLQGNYGENDNNKTLHEEDDNGA